MPRPVFAKKRHRSRQKRKNKPTTGQG